MSILPAQDLQILVSELAASKDPIMEEPMRKSLRDALPDAQVKVFEGLGHNPFWENPAGVAQVIGAFLATKPLVN